MSPSATRQSWAKPNSVHWNQCSTQASSSAQSPSPAFDKGRDTSSDWSFDRLFTFGKAQPFLARSLHLPLGLPAFQPLPVVFAAPRRVNLSPGSHVVASSAFGRAARCQFVRLGLRLGSNISGSGVRLIRHPLCGSTSGWPWLRRRRLSCAGDSQRDFQIARHSCLFLYDINDENDKRVVMSVSSYAVRLQSSAPLAVLRFALSLAGQVHVPREPSAQLRSRARADFSQTSLESGYGSVLVGQREVRPEFGPPRGIQANPRR
jgi:hypothetical protein